MKLSTPKEVEAAVGKITSVPIDEVMARNQFDKKGVATIATSMAAVLYQEIYGDDAETDMLIMQEIAFTMMAAITIGMQLVMEDLDDVEIVL